MALKDELHHFPQDHAVMSQSTSDIGVPELDLGSAPVLGLWLCVLTMCNRDACCAPTVAAFG